MPSTQIYMPDLLEMDEYSPLVVERHLEDGTHYTGAFLIENDVELVKKETVEEKGKHKVIKVITKAVRLMLYPFGEEEITVTLKQGEGHRDIVDTHGGTYKIYEPTEQEKSSIRRVARKRLNSD